MVELKENGDPGPNCANKWGEGGISVRDLRETQKDLFIDFYWRLLSMDNFWTKFFLAKYSRNGHICSSSQLTVKTKIWNSMLKVLLEVYKKCYVKV